MIFINMLLAMIILAGCATPQKTVAPGPAPEHLCIEAPEIARGTFVWPVRGEVTVPFDSKVDRVRTKGIDIKAPEGAEVRAARAGKVVFYDPSFRGMGKTIILDHADKYQTVYSYLSDVAVKAGDTVKEGDLIGRVGRTGRAKDAALHFEIRKNGEPQDPAGYLH